VSPRITASPRGLHPDLAFIDDKDVYGGGHLGFIDNKDVYSSGRFHYGYAGLQLVSRKKCALYKCQKGFDRVSAPKMPANAWIDLLH
jgi:hypothetical protein